MDEQTAETHEIRAAWVEFTNTAGCDCGYCTGRKRNAFDDWLDEVKKAAYLRGRADEREQAALRADKYGEEHPEIRVAFRNFAWLLRGMPGLAARGEDAK